MAHRFHLPVTTLSNGPSRLADGWREATAWRDRMIRRALQDRRLFAWQALWLPYWLGSDRPAPSLPAGRHVTNLSGRSPASGAEAYVDHTINGLVRQFRASWIAGSVLRGAWLSLLFWLGWMLLAIAGMASTPSPVGIAICALLLVGLGVVEGVLNRPTAPMVAAMLDRTFLLQERLTTACDVIGMGSSHPEEQRSVPRLQMADAANALGDVRSLLRWRHLIPVREIMGVLILGMALLTAIFAYIPDRRLPGISESPVPAFVPASQRLSDPKMADQGAVSPPNVENRAPTVAEVQEQARASQASREDLAAIGKALENNPTTRPAAEAIANGDSAAAADAIRSAANSAPGMSQEERNALADELAEAAEQVSSEHPELAEASREAAEGLRKGGAESTEGLGGLADEVEQTGAGVVSQEQLETNLREAQAGAGTGKEAGSPGEEQENGNQQSAESAGEAGNAGDAALSDPGEGVAAEPGVANPDQGGTEPNPGSASGGQGGQAPGSQGQEGTGSAPEGGAGQPSQDPSGEGAAPSGSASGESGAESSSENGQPGGASQGQSGRPAEETNASQGSGAGTGQTGANDSAQGEQTGEAPPPERSAPEAEVPQNGAASDRPPSGSGQPGEPGNSGSVSGGSTSLVLEGTSDNGVRTGSDSGSSSLGSGSGAGTASGDQVQGEVGVAGPDSNRVPEDQRDIVEDYFSDPGGAP